MEDNDRNVAEEEKLKTALHFSVGKICSQTAASFHVKFGKDFIATLSDLAYNHAGIFAEDLEAFAKHGKRATVTVDDVKLLVRRSKSLQEHIANMASELAANNKSKAKKRKAEESNIIDIS